MIGVDAKLVRGSAYLAGEELECEITFTNPENSAGIRLSCDIETLAWATAQIHCQCTVSETRVIPPGIDAENLALPSTYFHPTRSERGLTVMMTAPRILFCNIKLAPGESTVYTYKETIPRDTVPSFRGMYVKYIYKLTIGTQRPDNPISEIKIPFRVLLVEGIQDLSAYQDKEQELKPSNPFEVARKEQPEHSVLDIALQFLAVQSGKRRHKCYNISNARGRVAKIMVLKPAYKIGEDLICLFDFTESSIQCLQFSVALQSEERIEESLRKEGAPDTNIVSHCIHQEFCLHTQRANISLPIPLHVTPNFSSDIVTLKWRLHIEFVTLLTEIPEQEKPNSNSTAVLWEGRSDLETERIHWDVPIKLLATSPVQCALLPSMKSEDSILLE